MKIGLAILGFAILFILALKVINTEEVDENILPGWDTLERKRMMIRAEQEQDLGIW